ncbi:MAG: RNA polymerase sigma factor [Paenibacillaceae bacterium]|nr:RNA polymerase sigma factor [Paenibacillaceae bacterium]
MTEGFTAGKRKREATAKEHGLREEDVPKDMACGVVEAGPVSADAELVERARQGDTEAFGELIRQYRGKLRRIAEQMTGDPYMADDIVQDSLIRAFLHLGTLADTSRFLPWLHRIVRNQAKMRLRRGGPYRKEQPFTAFVSESGLGHQVEWDSIDSILYHLSRSASQAATKVADPAEQLLLTDMYETTEALLHCLNRKERAIFESYFFGQLPPKQIAAMFHTTTGTVYSYIHRSRQKLQQAQQCSALGLHEKGGIPMGSKKLLALPEWPQHIASLSTLVDRLGHLLAALGDARPMEWLMGVSGFAFRMCISNRTTLADGLYVFDWRQTVRSLLDEFGYEGTVLCSQLADSPVPLLAAAERFPVALPIEEAVLPFIRKYIDLGKPVLYFDTLASEPFVHEWSLIYGYDEAERVVYVTDATRSAGKMLPYKEVAENPLRFLVGIDGRKESKSADGMDTRLQERERAKRAILAAVDMARNGIGYVPMTDYLSYTSGLAAYDRWILYLRNEAYTVNRYGMGQLAAVHADARKYASAFLRVVPLEGEAMRLTLLAAEAFEQAAEELKAVSELVPFVRTSVPLGSDALALFAERLEQAKSFETAGVGYLEKSIAFWGRGLL